DKMISATTNPSMYQTALAQPGDLYARIAVIDAAGNMSPYSAVAKVDTVMTSIPVMFSSENYTKNAPSWVWSDIFNINAYQIQVQNRSGEVIHTEDLGKVSRYTFGAGHEHGKAFRARIRGSIDQGSNWGEWSNLSGLQTVDTEPPVLGLRSFMHTDATTAELKYTADGTLSGMSSIIVQIAEDAEFNQIITTRHIGRGEIWSNYMIKELPERSDLYVRIRGYDTAGNMSEFTPAMQIDSVLAEKPEITAERYMHSAPEWHWDKAYLATEYEIEITDEEGNIVHQNIGNVDRFIYTDGLVHGKTFTAKVHVSLDNGSTWSEWSDSRSITVDTVKPAPEVLDFKYTEQGKVQVVLKVTEETTNLQSAHLQVATDTAFVNLVYENALYGINVNDNNVYILSELPRNTKLYARLKAKDNAGNESDYSSVVAIGLSAPRLTQPVSGSTVYIPEVVVSGKAFPSSQVQLYIDGEVIEPLALTDEQGDFEVTVGVVSEGTHHITAAVDSNFAVSEQSVAAEVNYKIPLPLASFVTPSGASTIALPVLLEVSASDVLGIAKVDFYDGDTLLGSATEAPFQNQWNVRFADNGAHTLKAVVTNTSGKSVSVEQNVKVDVAPEKVPVPPTPYTGKVDGISPAISYGEQPISISGSAVDRATSEPMANRQLKLVLDVRGFKRTINIVTDATGAFSYNFIPQSNDKGSYQVSVIHPDEVGFTSQGGFNINRVGFNFSSYKLVAARNHPTQFSVNATASGDVRGLRWVAVAEDQPLETLPQGIVINGGSGIDMDEGKSTSTMITVTADDNAAETGTIYLRALSDDAGEMVRGTLRLDYKLVQAEPFLIIQKNSIQTGVAQGDSVSEAIVFTNKGLVAAQNVKAQLLDEHGNAPPAWMFLANTGSIGTANVGDEVSVQVTAQPNVNVAEGTYKFKLRISSDNSTAAEAFITVVITQSGIGGVRFSVADIYTATLDEDDLPILGVKGATIKLQNEAVLTEKYESVTGSDGTALFEDLPPGIYLFRASASSHMDISGRVRVRPGVVINQDIFLDYQLINIEFGVTETTIDDVYDIVLEATYQTEVPAPVVLVEPLSINLGGMQVGEELTGQLTLTNYGLIEAQEINFVPPQSDSEFKYEFFADIPDTLPPKTRIVI
ncbi:MAG: Ig-like domain-containing protein, partial [Saezia sp.]